MIDFRYHIVSIVAVFLALAVGVGLGSTALRGPVVNDLGSNVNRLTKENQSLRGNVSALKAQNKQQQQFAAEAAPRLLKGALTGEKVAVVSLPGATDANTAAVVKNLGLAGASVTARVQLTDSYTDPASEDKIAALAVQDQALLPGLQLPGGSNGVQQGTALLGAVLVGAPGVTVSVDARNSVLGSLATLGVAKIPAAATDAATAIVVVGGSAATGDNAQARNTASQTVVTQLAAATQQLVVTGSTGADGAIVAAVRGDGSLSKTVSTVDDVSDPTGQVATVLALTEESQGRSGQYGTGSGASALMPSAS